MSKDVGIAIPWRRLVACGALVVAGICGLGAQAGEAPGPPGAASYTEDFSVADRFRRDCVAESGLKVFPKLGLSSAGPQGGDVMYDLQKILPGWTKDSIVVLTYEGGGGDVGNQMIGVHCDSGPSTDQLAEFSKAAYGKPVVVRGRYLRFRIAWQQTAGPEYGFLKSFAVRLGTPADIPIPIAFTLDRPGVVTLVIDDAQGNRVRNLVSETPFEAGRHVVNWDGRDEHTPKRVSQQPVFRFEGEPVEPGTYVVRGIVRDPVHLRYEMPLYTAGNPPWDTPDGRGGWLQDYVPPTAVVGLSDKMLVGSPVGEAFGIVWTDLEGRRLGGLRGVSGGGGWAGAELLARDNGERADASVSAYVANNWAKTFEIEALTQKLPVGPYNGGVRTMSMCLWGAGRKVYRPDAGSMAGLAAHNMTVVAAIGNQNKLLVIQDKNMPGFGLRHGNPTVPDNRSGTKVAEVPVKEPRGLAVTPDGRHLLAISGQRIVRFPFPPAGEPAAVVSEGLKEPIQLTLDKDGNIYVSDQGTHQVKVFSSDGKPLRSIGKPGGPQLGPYDEQRMANPAGLAISADGRLWVAENSEFPRRVSIWTLDGKFVKALYGNCNYGGGGMVDTGNAGRGYVSQGGGTLQLRLDHEKAASEVEAILSLPDRGIKPPRVAYHVGYNRVMGFAVYRGGQRYLSNAFCTAAGGGSHIDNSISVWKVGGDGIAAMVASLGPAERWDILHRPEFDARLPQGTARDGGRYSKLVLYAWADLNGNGAVDAAEVQLVSKPEWGGSRRPTAFTLSEDMAITDCLGNRYRPTRFTEGGAPVFDLTVHDNIFSGARTTETSGGGQVIDGGDGWAVTTWSPDGFPAGYVAGAKDGELRWLYPAVSIGNHAGYESPPPSKPGQMIAISSLAGPPFTPRGAKERLWPVVGLKGDVYVLTTDGMFVATLFKDFRQAKPGPTTAERGALLNDMSLGDDAWSTTLTKSSDGNVYIVGGHDSTWVTRVDGLETIRRLPESEVVATEERQAAAMAVGAVTPASHPRFPVETLADGRKRFVYQADFQKDKKAADAVSSGTFADNPPGTAHCNGIYGAPTLFKFAVPGEIGTIEASAAYGNHADAAAHAYSIRYSLDGTAYNALVEKNSSQPGEVRLDGKVDAPRGTRQVWVSFAGIGNRAITLKQVSVALTYRETPAKGGAKVAASATADLVAAENAHLRIEFSRKDGVIRLAKLVNKSNQRNVLEDAGPLWRAETDKGNSAGDAPAKAASLAAKELPNGGARLTLRWEGAGALDVKVTVDVAPGSRETLWCIHPAAVDKNGAIKMLRFPAFDGVGRGGKWDRLVRPTFINERMLNPESLPESSILYPSGFHGAGYGMQFAIYEYAAPGCMERLADDQKQGDGGLYIAAYDPLMLVKQFSCKGLGEGKGTSLAIGHFAEGLVTDKDGKTGLGFPCAVGVFDGGYWHGLDLYREWVRTQAWCAAGPIRKRADFPKKLLHSHISHPRGFDPADKVLARLKEKANNMFENLLFEDFTDEEKATLVPSTFEKIEKDVRDFADPNTPHYCIQWYRWHIQPFDYAYPDYFPLRPGWMELRAQLDKAYPGYFIHMPYINGRCAVEHSELWTKNKAVMEKWSTGAMEHYCLSDFTVMCTDTDFWQDTITHVARRIFADAKVDGLYIDQLGHTPVRCMKTDHGHKPGDPASWSRGQQAMLRKIRAAAKPINPDAFFTTEFFAEQLVGLCDGFLTYAYSDLSTLAYVYGDYVVQHGHARSQPNSDSDCAMVADMFMAGAQFGWLVGTGGDTNPKAYQKKLVGFRPKALPYLLLPMVRPITGSQTNPFWTSLRKGDKGEAVVIATNAKYPSAKPPLTLDETYELDCQAAGLKPGKYRLKAITMDGEKDLGPQEVSGDVFKFQIKLEPFEAAVYVLEPLAAK